MVAQQENKELLPDWPKVNYTMGITQPINKWQLSRNATKYFLQIILYEEDTNETYHNDQYRNIERQRWRKRMQGMPDFLPVSM